MENKVPENFADRLINAIDEKHNPSVVGLDPRIEHIPEHLKSKHCRDDREAVADAFIAFNKAIIDAVYDIVPAVKPQLAFYEQYGHCGIRAFEETISYARSKGLIVIADAKRNDIGSTAEAYSAAYLGEVRNSSGSMIRSFDVDALTLNAYLGWDGVKPFVQACKEYNKGIFILAKTSNPSSGDLQDKKIDDKTVYEEMSHLIGQWGDGSEGKRGYRSIGAVVGATFPEQAKQIRNILPNSIFLVPGYGAQGAIAADIVACFNPDGYGAIINSSRGIIFAYMDDQNKNSRQFDTTARSAAIRMKEDISRALAFFSL